MSTELALSVLRTDAGGELVLETVREPHCGIAVSYICELFDTQESARWFSEVAAGCDLSWYRRPTMEICLAEQRNPTAADCYSPASIKRDVETVVARLQDLSDDLPRCYSLQRSSLVGRWENGAKVFYGGRLFDVGAGWNYCSAVWWAERPFMEKIEARISGVPDIAHDLRHRRTFECTDAVWTGTSWEPGEPLVLTIRSITPTERFRPFLERLLRFCDAASSGGYLVFTSKH